jgi:uncharacterized protein YjbI with pentapeptide repeats
MSRLGIAFLCSAVLVALSAEVTLAADLSVEQVRDRLRAASASAIADLSGKDLSDLDLSGIDFRHARLDGASLFASKLVNAISAAAICGRPTSMGPG